MPKGTKLANGQAVFVEAYLANGGNATQAYLEGHPGAKESTAATEGWRLLRNPKIAAVLEERKAEMFKRWEMKADEALSLIAARARLDVSELYDSEGKLLPLTQLPKAIRVCIKGIRRDAKGRRELVFHDALRAAELVAVATGKLRSKVDVNHSFDHAKHLAGLDEPPPEE